MPETSCLAITSGGRRLAFPLEEVKSVRRWEPSLPLPGAVSWLEGILPGEGEVCPVVAESYWGGSSGQPEVQVFLCHRGRLLALSGSHPEVLKTGSDARAGGKVDPAAPGSLAEGVLERACVDLPKLYSELGLGYNED